MKTSKLFSIIVLALTLVVLSANVSAETGLGTAFTYQGRLIDANNPAEGLYDLQFKLYDAVTDGNKIGLDVNQPDVTVTDGYFTLSLDFGSDVFNGDDRWLEIGVRPGILDDPNNYTFLSPRQQITATPYALQTRGIFVNNAGNVGIGTSDPQVKLSLGAEYPPTLKKLALWDGVDDFYGFGVDWGRITIDTNNTEKMTIADTGNVGIGTTWPIYKLDVNGPVNLNSGISTGVGLLVNGSEALWYDGTYFSWGFGGKANYFADNVGIKTTIPAHPLSFADTFGDKISLWGQTPGGNCVGFGTQAAQLQIYTDGSHADVVFGYGKSDSLTETMRIKGTGNVGIGTTAPAGKLHVSGNGAYSYYGIAPSDSAYNMILQAPSPGTGMFGGIKFNNTGNSQDRVAYIGAINDNYANRKLSLVFGTDDGSSSAERMRLTDSGRLGIGTTAPAAKLHCVGNGAYSYFGEAPTGDAYNIIIEAPSSGAGMFGGIKFNNTGNTQDRVAYIGSINESAANRKSSLVFGTDDGTLSAERMRITGTGYVGIGTKTPARSLHVSDVMRLQPRTTSPSSPAEGDIYMDGTTHKLMVYDGTVWRACW